MEVRAALLQLRGELNMRQTDLARELGVSAITLSRWENGGNRPSRAMCLALLAVASSHRASAVCQAALKEALLPSARKPQIDDLRSARLDQINALVNDSSNGVIVSDAENYDILYVNRQMASVTGKPVKLASQMKCYQYVFGREQPCEFCGIGSFSSKKYTTGTYESPRTGRYYVCRGKLVRWNERKAHIEYIADMTDFHLTQKELAYHRELLSLACENAQMWVFSLEVQTGTVHLDHRLQKTLGLPASVPGFITSALHTDEALAPYAEAFEQALAGLKNGQRETIELTVQTKIHSSRVHWVRFRAKLVERNGDGTPQKAICSAQIVDEEIAFRARIRLEHEQIIGSRKDLIGYVISNITRNTVLESRGQVRVSDFPLPGTPYDVAVRYAADRIEPPGDRQLFLQMHDRATLLAQFAAGRLEQGSDYQTLQPDGKLLWLRNKMKLLPQPATGDVLLYEYSFSQHSARMMTGLLAASTQSGYELLGAVSLLRDQVARLNLTPDGLPSEEPLTFASYTEETAAYCQRCVIPEEREAFLQATALETLVRELQKRSIYRVSYQETGADGLPHTKISQYTLYDGPRQFCLLSTLDLERLTASIKNVDVIHTEAKE